MFNPQEFLQGSKTVGLAAAKALQALRKTVAGDTPIVPELKTPALKAGIERLAKQEEEGLSISEMQKVANQLHELLNRSGMKTGADNKFHPDLLEAARVIHPKIANTFTTKSLAGDPMDYATYDLPPVFGSSLSRTGAKQLARIIQLNPHLDADKLGSLVEHVYHIGNQADIRYPEQVTQYLINEMGNASPEKASMIARVLNEINTNTRVASRGTEANFNQVRSNIKEALDPTVKDTKGRLSKYDIEKKGINEKKIQKLIKVPEYGRGSYAPQATYKKIIKGLDKLEGLPSDAANFYIQEILSGTTIEEAVNLTLAMFK